MPASLGLGRIFNYIETASGVHIPLTNAQAITFVGGDAGVGAAILTLKESIGGASEQNLAVIDTIYKGPDVGGTWTKVTQAAAATFDLGDDTTNDSFMITILGTELSDTFDSLEATVDTGVCHAIIHDLAYPSKPENLASSI